MGHSNYITQPLSTAQKAVHADPGSSVRPTPRYHRSVSTFRAPYLHCSARSRRPHARTHARQRPAPDPTGPDATQAIPRSPARAAPDSTRIATDAYALHRATSGRDARMQGEAITQRSLVLLLTEPATTCATNRRDYESLREPRFQRNKETRLTARGTTRALCSLTVVGLWP